MREFSDVTWLSHTVAEAIEGVRREIKRIADGHEEHNSPKTE